MKNLPKASSETEKFSKRLVVKNKKKRKNATFAKHSQGAGAADKQPTRALAELGVRDK